MTSLPKTLTVSKTLAEVAAKRDIITNEGFFALAITKGENREGNNKDQAGAEKVSRLQEVLTLAPMKNHTDPKSAIHELALKKYLILPDRGPSSIEPEDAEAEMMEQAKKVRQLVKDMRAIFGHEVVPYAPRKNLQGKYEYDGEEIDAAYYEQCVLNMNVKAMEVVYDMWGNPEKWVFPKKFVYAKIVQQLGNDGVSRPNVAFLVDKLPDDATLLPYSEWFKAPVK